VASLAKGCRIVSRNPSNQTPSEVKVNLHFVTITRADLFLFGASRKNSHQLTHLAHSASQLNRKRERTVEISRSICLRSSYSEEQSRPDRVAECIARRIPTSCTAAPHYLDSANCQPNKSDAGVCQLVCAGCHPGSLAKTPLGQQWFRDTTNANLPWKLE